jgi:hypothetical protein
MGLAVCGNESCCIQYGLQGVEVSRHIGLHAPLKAIRGMAFEIDKKGLPSLPIAPYTLEYTSKKAFGTIMTGPKKAMGWDGVP